MGLRGVVLTLLCCLVGTACGADEVDFRSEIRPILSDNCFKCHGPDETHREAGLRLDTRDGALADLGGYAALVPGRPEQSTLYERITTDDESLRMPPVDSGRELTADEVQLLRRWIREGAVWTEHWAFVPPTRPALPTVQQADWPRNPIDVFILARLEKHSLQPAPEADRGTLLRRLSLDLIGLPPTPAELKSFLADARPDAYERQVERLLKSPHYGERWGRVWLDAARYADSNGFEKDKPRQVWFYRDWVIQALNRDMPYDEFIIEQIAGDLLPKVSQSQQVATGFLRNSMLNEEGGVDPEQFRMEAMYDRMDAVGRAILGLTIQCGQCHSHKYDPLTQTEYYRMFAFLNNAHEGQITVYTPAEQQERDAIQTEIGRIEARLQHEMPDWPQRMLAWERDVLAREQPQWDVARLEFDEKTIGGQKFLPMPDGSYRAQGYAPTKFAPQMSFQTETTGIRALRLELLTDPNLPHGGPGRSLRGTCALTEFEVEAAAAAEPEKATRHQVVAATADLSLPERPLSSLYDDRSETRRVTGPVEFAMDGKSETAWEIDAGPGRRNQPRKAVFQIDPPINQPGGAKVTITLSQKHGGWNSDDNQTNNLGRFRISYTTAPDAQADPLPADVRTILETTRSPLADSSSGKRVRTETEQERVFAYWRARVPEWSEANRRIEELWASHPAGTSQLVLIERDNPRETCVLERGDFLKPQHAVKPGVPAFLHSFPAEAPRNRLGFAQWLVDRRSPTTSRALVNRVWQTDFGKGIVETSEDLGSQGAAPTHPGLLDWLAVEFMDDGWSLKTLHRLIVTSSTYRQSSVVSAEKLRQDPSNRLLARGPRFRVQAELVRDSALAVSGLLDRTVGGPSVYPPAPEFLFQPPASYGPKVWHHDRVEDRYRRAIYTFRFRSVPYPALETFDAPNGDTSCVRRARSNTPLQALTLLNEPLFVECARGLARRVLREAPDSHTERLQYAFRLCFARSAAQAEIAVLTNLYEKQLERFRSGQGAPAELAAIDNPRPGAVPEDVAPEQLAAWTALARVLLNLDEMITKE